MDSEAGRYELKRIAERRLSACTRKSARPGQSGPYLLGRPSERRRYLLVMLCRWTRKMAKPATDLAELKRLVNIVSPARRGSA